MGGRSSSYSDFLRLPAALVGVDVDDDAEEDPGEKASSAAGGGMSSSLSSGSANTHDSLFEIASAFVMFGPLSDALNVSVATVSRSLISALVSSSDRKSASGSEPAMPSESICREGRRGGQRGGGRWLVRNDACALWWRTRPRALKRCMVLCGCVGVTARARTWADCAWAACVRDGAPGASGPCGQT